MLLMINTIVDCYRGAGRLSPGAAVIAASCITFCSSAIASQSGSAAADTYIGISFPVARIAMFGDGKVDNVDGSANAQCLEGEWRGKPLVARYRVTNHTVEKRLASTPRKTDVVVATGDSKSDLHQWEMANKLLEGLSAGSSSSSEFVLWREGEVYQRVAHEHPAVAITEVWNKPSDSLLRRSRHFDANQRAIEFEPFSIAPAKATNIQAPSVANLSQPSSDIWLQKYHLAYELPEPATPILHPDGYTKLLKQALLTDVEKRLLNELANKQACGELKVIHDLRKRFSSEVVWDESMKLPVYMQFVRDNSAPLDFTQPKSERNSVGALSAISRWVLVSLETDKQLIGDRFSKWDSYDTTDFSDIGDNESDPFLMRMINLGFISHGASGFYDSSGNLISSGIGHYHPPVSGAR